MKVRFIVNPAAGGSDRTARITDAVRSELSTVHGFFEVRALRSKGDARRLSEEAAAKGYDIVVACGGDGTINEAAGPLVGTRTALAVVPLGSGNGFANALLIPRDIRGAIRLIKAAKTREIDAGEICGRMFFATAGIGFDARLSKVYNRGRISKRLRGVAPYYPLALFQFLFYRPAEVLVMADGIKERLSPFVIAFANTEEYGGGARIAPGALPDDGLLDLCIVENGGRLKAPILAKKFLSGKIDEFKGYRKIRVKSARISSKQMIEVHADGEPFDWEGEVTVGVRHKAVRVVVP